MSPPLAVLIDEERHWLTDLGLPNQRRWLNHRNSVTSTAERSLRRGDISTQHSRAVRGSLCFVARGLLWVCYRPRTGKKVVGVAGRGEYLSIMN